jgi:tripartite-type tricarboxylate transporter receptor subunit TctC
MRFSRRQFLSIAAGVVLPAISRTATVQSYPARTVRIVVGYAAGGMTDISGRLIGQWLSERFGQQFVVENRPGAANNIATEVVAKAPPDGYTLLLVVTSNAANEALFNKLNFVFLRDITPVGGLASLPYVLMVNPSFDPKTIPDFIAYAKANPGKLTIGAPGGTTQAAIELLKTMAGIDIRYVPYRGDAPGLTDLLGGQVDMYLSGIPSTIEQVRAGTLRALGVASSHRSEVLPEIPTLGEFVAGYEASGWQGIGAPKGTPVEIIDRLNKEINAALADPKFRARLGELGGAPMPMTASQFGKFLADETEKWSRVIRAANFRPE